VEVSFYRAINVKDRRPWVARVRKMRVDGSILGSSVGNELPHDLVTFVVERELGVVDGFFATVAAGGTFRSMAKKRHGAGKAVIARNRPGLDRAERLVHEHWDAWRQDRPTPCQLPRASTGRLAGVSAGQLPDTVVGSGRPRAGDEAPATIGPGSVARHSGP